MRILELFAGIGACSKALEKIGIDVEIVDAVEIDKYAMASFNAIHGTDFEVQDIKEWNKDIGDIDLITHGSPCQDFSIAGKQEGGDLGSGTRSSLMYETIRIVGKIRPKYVLWENVKNILSKKHKHNFDAYIETMNILGYNSYYKVLNAKDYGVPQNRERVYTISIRKDIDMGYEFPEPMELKLRLKDILEDVVDEKYYLNNSKLKAIAKWNAHQKPLERVLGQESVSPTLTARGAGEEHSGMILYSEDLKNTANLQEEILCTYLLDNKDEPGVTVVERRGRVGHQVSQTIMANDSMGVVINPLKDRSCYGWHFEQNVYDVRGITRSLKAGGGSGNIPKVIENRLCEVPTTTFRIRKLTPKECWRLMGFDDEDFEKAQRVGISNTQLYKQAGNSIVVNVLENIFKKLF